MKIIKKSLIWTQIALQALLPVFAMAKQIQPQEGSNPRSAAASPFSVDRTSDNSMSQPDDTLPFSSELSQSARILTSDNASESARSLAVGTASGQIQQWLNQFGTARIQLNMDRHGNWDHSSGDLLIPVYDNQHSLLFFQGGIRKPDDRLTGNLGMGVRTFWQNGWMYGGNFFFDNDFTGHNRRVGIGGEAWRDYLRLSANTYIGTTNWHNSRDFESDWQEKPADGFDIRAQGWLPAYPQLGAKLTWEKYYGNQVALFDKDHLQQNPYAITAGLDFTPVPFVSIGVDHKQGRGEQDTQLSLGLHWQFGHDWQWQIDPSNVKSMRTLAGSRYDLVDRNNEIVLQYRKNPNQEVSNLALTTVTDNSPADGITRNVLQVLVTNRDGQPVPKAPISWNAISDGSASLIYNSTVTDDYGLATATITSTRVQSVPVRVQSGKISAMQNSNFVAVAVSNISLTVTQDNALADGVSADIVEVTLTDSNNRPVSGQKVNWKLPEGVTIRDNNATSDSSGKVTVSLLSTIAGSAAISATVGNLTAKGTIHFSGNAASAKISSLSIITDGSPADGKTRNVAQIIVKDANGNPLSGQTIDWKADKSTVRFEQSPITDNNGKTTVSYTDTVAESLTVTATLANSNSATASSIFVADNTSARLKDFEVTSGAKASGADFNTGTVTVTDANNNPLSNVLVTFTITGNAKLNATTVNTDSNGKALVTFTDTEAETVQVTAKLAAGSSMTKESSFVTDLDSASLSLASTSGALADGSATNTVTITLKDKNGSSLSGQSITLITSGNAKLSSTKVVTDDNGQAIVTLTDNVEEAVTITASLINGKKESTEATFIAFSVATISTSSSSVKANSIDMATITATVKDINGREVVNTPVTFRVTGNAKLNTTTAITNSSGQAQVTLTDDVGENVTVTAIAQKSQNDSGKTVNVIFVGSSFTKISVNGSPRNISRTFSVESGFPQTGFMGASFTLEIDNGNTPVAEYTWSSNQSWVTVKNGIVTFSGTPSSATKGVTITATPKTGGGNLTWSFTLQNWFTFSSGTMSPTAADSYCSNLGQSVPSKDILDYTDKGNTKVGSLWSEWADSIDSQSYRAVWAAEEGRGSRYYMFVYDGHIYDNAGSNQFGAACVSQL